MRVGAGTLSDMRSRCCEVCGETIDAIWRVAEGEAEERHAVLMPLDFDV